MVQGTNEVAKWFEETIPDVITRSGVLRFLDEAIAHAHAQGHDCWSVLFTPASLRLIVGHAEVLTITKQTMHLLVQDGVAAQRLRKIAGLTPLPAPTIPGALVCDFPTANAATVLTPGREPHLQLISRMSAEPLSEAARLAHSPMVVDYLNHYLLSFLSQPAYTAAGMHR